MAEDRLAVKMKMPCHIGGSNRCIGKAKSIKCVLYINAIYISYFLAELLTEGGVDFLWCFVVLRIILRVSQVLGKWLYH